MVIQFECPNGHQLSAPEDRAGKTGRCPKCQEEFKIPAPEDDELDEEEEEEAESDDDDEEEKPETIVFLCPNNHKLTGPAALRGKIGRCPHCGEKFRIPEEDEELDEDDEDVLFDEPAASGAPSLSAVIAGDASGEDGEEDEEEEEAAEDDAGGEDAEVPAPPMHRDGHEMAGIIRRLWPSRAKGATLLIQLRQGESLEAEYFSPQLSQEKYGVFAVRDGDEVTVSAVAWDDVTHVSLRTRSLPKGLFG